MGILPWVVQHHRLQYVVGLLVMQPVLTQLIDLTPDSGTWAHLLRLRLTRSKCSTMAHPLASGHFYGP